MLSKIAGILLIFFACSAVSFVVHQQRQTATNLKSTNQRGDPNFEAHLPSLLRAGSSENRPSPDLASDLRKRFKQIEGVKRKAAAVLKSENKELAIELEELADELAETHENFVQTATWWDAWNRPSPDIASDLRYKEEAKKGVATDPNFLAHLPDMLKAGSSDSRPAPELPSELRLLKFKNMASVKRIAARELRARSQSPELAVELDEIADEIEESHKKFLEIASQLRSKKFE